MPSANGLLINKNVQAFHKKDTNSLTRPSLPQEMRMTSPFRKKNHFSCIITAAVDQKRVSWKLKEHNPVAKSTDIIGRLVHDGLVYSQNVMIRSFEVGFDGKISTTALMNYLQDVAVNHGRIIGLTGFHITPEMCRKDLIWVFSNLQLVVDQYPSWLDEVQVDSWIYPSGQNGLGRDWIVRDRRTGDAMAHATSRAVLMNKKTRKLSKFTTEIRQDLASSLMDCAPIVSKDTRKMVQLDFNIADFVRTGLKTGWNDIDLNQHVNNVKYITWILESVPSSLMEHHNLSAMKLEYRRECNRDSVLHSLSKIVTKNGIHHSTDANHQNQVELEHSLLLENGLEIVRGRTLWKPRNANNL